MPTEYRSSFSNIHSNNQTGKYHPQGRQKSRPLMSTFNRKHEIPIKNMLMTNGSLQRVEKVTFMQSEVWSIGPNIQTNAIHFESAKLKKKKSKTKKKIRMDGNWNNIVIIFIRIIGITIAFLHWSLKEWSCLESRLRTHKKSHLMSRKNVWNFRFFSSNFSTM